jgi:hypothetical protein
MVNQQEISSVDLTVRNAKQQVVMVTLLPNSSSGAVAEKEVVYEGMLSDPNDKFNQSILLRVGKDDVDSLRLSDPTLTEREIHILDEDGEETGYYFEMEQVVEPDSSHKIFSGRYFAPDSEPVNFTALTDPEPIIVIVGVVAAACAFKIVFDTVKKNCVEELSDAIEACRKNGGLPTVEADILLGFSRKPLRIGCASKCSIKCLKGENATAIAQTLQLQKPQIVRQKNPIEFSGKKIVSPPGGTTTPGTTIPSGDISDFDEDGLSATASKFATCLVHVWLESVTAENLQATGNDWEIDFQIGSHERHKLKGSFDKTKTPAVWQFFKKDKRRTSLFSTSGCGVGKIPMSLRFQQYDGFPNEDVPFENEDLAYKCRVKRAVSKPYRIHNNENQSKPFTLITFNFVITSTCVVIEDEVGLGGSGVTSDVRLEGGRIIESS